MTRAWKLLILRWHHYKSSNSVESKEHTQRLNSAKELLLPLSSSQANSETLRKAREAANEYDAVIEWLRREQARREEARREEAQQEEAQREEARREEARRERNDILREEALRKKVERLQRQQLWAQRAKEARQLRAQLAKEARQVLAKQKEEDHQLRAQMDDDEHRLQQEEEEHRRQQEEEERRQQQEEDEVQAQLRQQQVPVHQVAKMKAKQAEVRQAKARATKRETNRMEVIVVYQGPDLDWEFVTGHLPGLALHSIKGGFVDSKTGLKAVWLKFGRELRRTAIRKAIWTYNLSTEKQLEICLMSDESVICSKARKRLQHHEFYLRIVSAKGMDAGYWEK